MCLEILTRSILFFFFFNYLEKKRSSGFNAVTVVALHLQLYFNYICAYPCFCKLEWKQASLIIFHSNRLSGPIQLVALFQAEVCERLYCWDHGFESCWRHGCSSVLSAVCYVGSGPCDWLITRPEESYCRVCIIEKPQQWGGLGPRWFGVPQKTRQRE